MLLEHSPGAATVEELGAAATTGDADSNGWHLASLTLLLPDVIEHHDAGIETYCGLETLDNLPSASSQAETLEQARVGVAWVHYLTPGFADT